MTNSRSASSLAVRRIVVSGVCVALCIVLPFLTGQIPQIGSMLSPMHIPVLLCGFLCGWPYGLVVGAISPLLRSLLFGMPPLYPVATAMAFELAAYGAFSGICYKLLPKKIPYVYVSLVIAMLGGRIVWGIAQTIMLSGTGNPFTFAAFMSGAFINAVPAIILHIVLIPILVIALKKAGIIYND